MQVIVLDPAIGSDVSVPSPVAPVEKSRELSEQSTVDAVPPSAFESTLIVTSVSGEFENETVLPLNGLAAHVVFTLTATDLVVAPSAW